MAADQISFSRSTQFSIITNIQISPLPTWLFKSPPTTLAAGSAFHFILPNKKMNLSNDLINYIMYIRRRMMWRDRLTRQHTILAPAYTHFYSTLSFTTLTLSFYRQMNNGNVEFETVYHPSNLQLRDKSTMFRIHQDKCIKYIVSRGCSNRHLLP